MRLLLGGGEHDGAALGKGARAEGQENSLLLGHLAALFIFEGELGVGGGPGGSGLDTGIAWLISGGWKQRSQVREARGGALGGRSDIAWLRARGAAGGRHRHVR